MLARLSATFVPVYAGCLRRDLRYARGDVFITRLNTAPEKVLILITDCLAILATGQSVLSSRKCGLAHFSAAPPMRAAGDRHAREHTAQMRSRAAGRVCHVRTRTCWDMRCSAYMTAAFYHR